MSPVVMHLWDATVPLDIEATVTTANDSSVSTFVVDLPSGLTTGKLAVIIMRCGYNPTFIATPSGWTKLIESSDTARAAVLYRVCDGTEGSTVSVYIETELGDPRTSRNVAVAMRVGGATLTGDFIEATADTVTKDPPSLTPSWGSAENLWLAVYSSRYSDWSVTTYPTNYTEAAEVFHTSSSSADYTGIAVGERTVTATTEDPGVFTIATVTGVSAERVFTIAVRPA